MTGCETVRELLSDYTSGRLAGEPAHEVTAHLAGCQTCRSEAEIMAGTWKVLDEYPELEPGPGFLGAVVRRTRPPAFQRFLFPLVAAAAAVLIVAGVVATGVRPTADGDVERALRALPPEDRDLLVNWAKNRDLVDHQDFVRAYEFLSTEAGEDD